MIQVLKYARECGVSARVKWRAGRPALRNARKWRINEN